MSYINTPPDLRVFFEDIKNRLRLLETSARFTAPVVATDPTNPRKGDIWINSTSNLMKVVDANGSIRIISWT